MGDRATERAAEGPGVAIVLDGPARRLASECWPGDARTGPEAAPAAAIARGPIPPWQLRQVIAKASAVAQARMAARALRVAAEPFALEIREGAERDGERAVEMRQECLGAEHEAILALAHEVGALRNLLARMREPDPRKGAGDG